MFCSTRIRPTLDPTASTVYRYMTTTIPRQTYLVCQILSLTPVSPVQLTHDLASHLPDRMRAQVRHLPTNTATVFMQKTSRNPGPLIKEEAKSRLPNR